MFQRRLVREGIGGQAHCYCWNGINGMIPSLRRLKKFGLAPKTLTNLYRCTIESILLGCITTTLYGNCTAHNRRALQRVMRSAQPITGGKLPALQDTYSTRCHRKPQKILKPPEPQRVHPTVIQMAVRSAQRITRGKLLALQDTYSTRCHRKSKKIIKDNNQPSHCLFTPLSSRR